MTVVLAALLAASVPEGGIEVPMALSGTEPRIEARAGGEGPLRFLLDTGASGDGTITATLAKRLALETVGEVEMGDPSGKGSIKGTLVRLPRLEIGGAVLEGLVLASRPDGDPAGWETEGADGVLGLGAFRGAVVVFDYPAQRLGLTRSPLPEPDGKRVLSYTAPHGVPRCRVRLGEREVEADIDTGSQGGFLVPESLARELSWAEPPRVVGKIRTGFNEAEIRAGRSREPLRIGALEIPEPDVEISPLLPNANLGGRILSRLRVTFDPGSARVRFESGPPGAAPPVKRRYGVMLDRPDEAFLVLEGVAPGSRAEAAGLRQGDRIIAVNGTAVSAMPEGAPMKAFGASPIRLRVRRGPEEFDVSMNLDSPHPSDGAPPAPMRRRFDRYPAWKDLADLVSQVRQAEGDPALAAAVVRGGTVVESAVAGSREIGTDRKAAVEDRFHVGSVAKPMTGTLIGRLVEMGKLDWNSTLAALLPGVEMLPAYREVTVEQLLRHRGGIPQYMRVTREQVERHTAAGAPEAQRASFVRALLLEPPAGPVGAFAYSNAGYALLGHIAERVAGKPWETLMKELVFDPLGMTRSGFGWPATADRPDEPRGHYPEADGLRVQKLDEYKLGGWLAPAGNVHASIGDLGRFAAAHLRGMRGEDGLLRAATVRRLHTPPKVPPGEEEYAAGWEIDPMWTDPPFHGKGGSAGTFRCHIAIFAEADLAVAACDNRGGEEAPSAPLQVALAVARKLAPSK